LAPDYDRAGERYRAYADGRLGKALQFRGSVRVWRPRNLGLIGQALHELRLGGVRELSVVDLGCGPGTWLRRVIDRARHMGLPKSRRAALTSLKRRFGALVSFPTPWRHAAMSICAMSRRYPLAHAGTR